MTKGSRVIGTAAPLLVLVLQAITCCSGLVRTPVTVAHFNAYRKTLPKDFNVVQAGGWNALERKVTEELGAQQLKKLTLPEDIVASTSVSTLQYLAADPKGMLLASVKSQLQPSNKNSVAITTSDFVNDNLSALIALLRAQGKGFDSDLVDGEWTLVMQKQGEKSPTVQKLVGKTEKVGKSLSTFHADQLTFSGDVSFFRRLGKIDSTVQYRPVSDGFDFVVLDSNKKQVVLRRIMCDIVGAGIRVWKLPRLPLPFLRKKGGYLDFVYLDRDLRVTTGNRGGFFVHVRPQYLQKMLLQQQ